MSAISQFGRAWPCVMVGLLCRAAGCAASAPHQGVEFPPSSLPAAPQVSQQSAGVASLSSQYQSELPWKAVLLLVSYVGLEAVKQSWIVYLSHRREVVRLNQSDRLPRVLGRE